MSQLPATGSCWTLFFPGSDTGNSDSTSGHKVEVGKSRSSILFGFLLRLFVFWVGEPYQGGHMEVRERSVVSPLLSCGRNLTHVLLGNVCLYPPGHRLTGPLPTGPPSHWPQKLCSLVLVTRTFPFQVHLHSFLPPSLA